MHVSTVFTALSLMRPGVDVDVAAGGRTEVRGGVAPLYPGASTSRPMAAVALTPAFAFRLASPRWSVLLRYHPRLFWRFPNRLDLDRPLVLHQASGSYGHALTRRWSLNVDTNAAIGEVDYTALGLVFPGVQSTLPNTGVLSYANISAMGWLGVQLARRHRLRFGGGGGRSGPLDYVDTSSDPEDGVPDRAVIPTQVRGNAAVEYMYAASRRDDVQATGGITSIDFSTSQHYLVSSIVLGWAHRFSRTTDGVLRGGTWVVQLLESRDDEPLKNPVIPVADIGVRSQLHGSQRVRLSGTAGASMTGYVDPIFALVEPRAGGTLGLALEFPPDWTARVEATMYTAATARPRTAPALSPAGVAVLFDQTLFAASLPITWEFAKFAALEFGARFTARAPHLRADNWELHRVEAWGYAALIVMFGTDGRGLDWVP